MSKNTQENQSIESIIKMVEDGKLLLPEFQRDFKWGIEKSETLFDSIFRELFIGSLILSKPKFDLACKSFDLRERGSKGRKPVPKAYGAKDFEERGIYTLLDGQQRISSIYRALKGVDKIYVIFKNYETLSSEDYYDKQKDKINKRFTDYIEGFDTKKPKYRTLYISISDLYKSTAFRESKFIEEMLNPLVIEQGFLDSEIELLASFLIQLKSEFLSDILKRESLLSVQLLDMDLEHFCLYFERSNAQGMTLSFTDIINAKVYIDFKLFRAITDAKRDNRYFKDKLVDPIVRYINYLENGQVTKKSILSDLRGEHFVEHWDTTIKDIDEVFEYLIQQRWIFADDKMPYVAMLLPLLSFYQNLKIREFSQATPSQIGQLKYWFFGSIIDHRYGGARHGSTNVVIKEDCDLMKKLAMGDNPDKLYWQKIRIDYSYDEFRKMDSISNAKAVGVQFLLYNNDPFLNLDNNEQVVMSGKVDMHHIFPENFLKKKFGKNSDEYDFSGTILNKMRINKKSNILIADKSPKSYLSEIKETNSNIVRSLISHSISKDCASKLLKGELDSDFFKFIKMRYDYIKPHLDKLKEIGEELSKGKLSDDLWS